MYINNFFILLYQRECAWVSAAGYHVCIHMILCDRAHHKNAGANASTFLITSYNYAILLDFNAAKQFSNNEKTDTI